MIALPLLLSLATAPNAPIVVLADEMDRVPLGRAVEILDDASGALKATDLSRPDVAKRFERSREQLPSRGFTSSAIWVRFRLRNPEGARQVRWLLQVAHPPLNRLDLYCGDQRGQRQRASAGNHRPFSERPLPHRTYLFPLEIQPAAELTCALRVKTASSLLLPLTLWRPEAFFATDQRQQLFYGVVFGWELIMALYGLLMWLLLRDRAHATHMLLVGSVLVFQAAASGHAYRYLWPGSPWLASVGLVLFASFTLIWAVGFPRVFLRTARGPRWLDRALLATGAAGLLNALLSLWLPTALTAPLLSLTALAVLILVPTAAVLSLRRGFRPARAFLIGCALCMVGFGFVLLKDLGFAPVPLLAIYGRELAAVSMVTFGGVGLAQRIHLLREQQRFFAVFAAAEDGTVIVSREGTITACNPAAVTLFGLDSEQRLLGQRLESLGAPGNDPRLLDARIQGILRAGKGAQRLDWVFTKGDGSAFPADVLLGAVDWEDRRAMQAVLRDISQQKRAEAELRQAKQAAEQARTKLEHAIEASRALTIDAERATVTKGQFLANISHELRTPLNGVVGMTELLLSTELDAEQHEQAEALRRSAQILLHLVNNILDLSKIEARKLDLERLPFDPRQLLATLRHDLALDAGEQLELRWQIASDVPAELVGDPTRVAQLVTNMTHAAVSGTSRGAVDVRVSHTDADDRAELRFEISHEGLDVDGLEPLLRHDQAPPGGADQGLSLVLRISGQLAELMGGAVGLDRPGPDGEAKLWLTIKLGRSEAATAATRAVPRAAKAQILVAEDNPVSQRVAVRLLEKRGYQVVAVASGREAIAALLEGPYQLVLMDLQMPEMDGLEAATAIRAGEAGAAGREVPIIAMTAHSMKGDRERCLAAGMNDYITKPISAAQLTETIARWLGTAG